MAQSDLILLTGETGHACGPRRRSSAFGASRPSGEIAAIPAGALTASRQFDAPVNAGDAFDVICAIGGRNGWYFANWLWRIRGALDVLAGGVGLGRGRCDATRLAVGDTLDCWRVAAVGAGRLLLRGEMRSGGDAWLELAVTPLAEGSRLALTATFAPRGWAGWLYWHVLRPVHAVLFAGLLRAIARRAAAGSAVSPVSTAASGILSELGADGPAAVGGEMVFQVAET